MLALALQELYKVVRQRYSTICGNVPIPIALLAGRELGVTVATLVRRMAFKDVSGDLETVVDSARVCMT
jgi:AmmeMemoRadiSam system protein B